MSLDPRRANAIHIRATVNHILFASGTLGGGVTRSRLRIVRVDYKQWNYGLMQGGERLSQVEG